MPKDVDRYFDDVKKNNPDYSDEQAWATAWSIFCKHKDPGSDHCKKPTSEYLKKEALTLAYREARQQLFAMEHTSPKALREYLREHPGADKTKHTVTKHEKEHHEEEAPKKSWKERLQGLSDKAKNFLKEAPKAVKQFVEDEAYRSAALEVARKTIREAPEKTVKKFIETAKHEVKEFKEAGQGIAAVLKGGKMSDHQKKAFKTVATHMAVTVAAAALTTTGPLAAAGAVGKGLVKHVALKAVANIFAQTHFFEELGHIGHGVKHIMEKLSAEEQADPEEVMAHIIMAAVTKELEGLSDKDIKEALESMSEGEKKASSRTVVAKFLSAKMRREDYYDKKQQDFQKLTLALTDVLDDMTDPKAKGRAEDLLTDLGENLDDAINLEGTRQDRSLEMIRKNLDELETLLSGQRMMFAARIAKIRVQDVSRIMQKLRSILDDVEDMVEIEREEEAEKKEIEQRNSRPVAPKSKSPAGPKSPVKREPKPKKTYATAMGQILTGLEDLGWKVSRHLKIPHATSPGGAHRFWFKAQAIYHSGGLNVNSFGSARSTFSGDIRQDGEVESFLQQAKKLK
jgi:hypothetical protein